MHADENVSASVFTHSMDNNKGLIRPFEVTYKARLLQPQRHVKFDRKIHDSLPATASTKKIGHPGKPTS